MVLTPHAQNLKARTQNVVSEMRSVLNNPLRRFIFRRWSKPLLCVPTRDLSKLLARH
jgi:hypothetical protein